MGLHNDILDSQDDETAQSTIRQLRAERDAALEDGHQVVEALQGDPTPLPDSYYSVAVAVRELRMMLAKSEAEYAEFRAHAWSEQKKLQQRLAEVERHRDLLAEVQANLALELRTTHGRLAEANSKLDEWQRMFRDVSLELDAEHTKLTTAQQENERLRVLIKPIAMGPCTCTQFRDGSVHQCLRCRASAALDACEEKHDG